MTLNGAFQGWRERRRVENGFDKRALIFDRQPDDLRFLDSLLRGVLRGSDYKITDATAL